MAGFLPGDPSHHGMVESGPYNFSHEKTEERDRYGSNWYFSRKEIEENSPSRRDGIDLKKETYFRKSYCTFLQDLGIRLKVPQVTIATAIMFCHRFFLRQSHAKNDRRTIATVCMFLAGKVEETPHPLKDVILVSYEIIHKKDHAAVQRIKQKEVYEQQKELILVGERVVLATLGFDLNVHHPYKPLVEAIKKFKVAQNALAQVAWNFVNDGLRTSLCLQFKPHHIAAGAIFLAAKFLKVKLPSDGENVWRKEFDVTPRQLEEVSNQMLELYEQSRVAPPPASHGSEVEGSGGGANNNQRAPAKTPEPASSVNGYSQATVKQGGTGARVDSYSGPQRSITHNQSDVYGSIETKNGALDYKEVDSVGKEGRQEPPLEYGERNETGKVIEQREKPSTSIGGQSDTGGGKGALGGPTDAMKKIDKEKVKAALEKRRKSRGDVTRKPDLLDDYDLLERELENGVELAVAEDEKMKRERRQQRIPSSMMPSYGLETDEMGEIGSSSRRRSASFDSGEGHRSEAVEADNNTEEGELSSLDAPPRDYNSPKPRKRKLAETTSPQGKDSRLDYYAAERDHHRGYRQEPHHV